MSLRRRWHALATCLVLLLCVVPVIAARNPPLHDYQFHIARMYILTEWHSSAIWRDHYEIGSLMLPNIAMDVIVPFLSRAMPVEAAGRVFIALTLILQVSGCLALHRSIHGRFSSWPLVSALFVYNWIFIFGFLNYLFGIGVLLWATAIWVAISRRSHVARIVCGSILSVALFLCHIIDCALFAVIVAAYELQRAGRIQRYDRSAALAALISGAAIFILPGVLFLASSTAGIVGGTSHKLINLLHAPAIFVRILMAADWTLDVILVLVVIGFAALVARVGRVVVAPTMYLVIGLLIATFLLIPHELAGDWGADSRIPLVIVFVLIASTRPVFPGMWERAVFLALLGVVAIRSALLAYNWNAYDSVYADFRRAFAALPAGGILFSATEDGIPSLQDINLRLWQPPLEHVATLAVFDGVFVPQVWAKAGQQPITVTPRYAAIYEYQNNGPVAVTNSAELDAAARRMRELTAQSGAGSPAFLLLLYPQRLRLRLPDGLSVIASGPDFLLLALGRAGAVQPS